MDGWDRYFIVGAGGAIGAVARFAASVQFGATPLTTFAVNVSGSFLIGLLINSAIGTDLRWRLLLGTGFLGGYTTFSTLALEALLSSQSGRWNITVLSLLGSSIAGLAAAYAGFVFGGRLR
jgi:CrcB protein